MSTHFGRGLRELGLQPKSNVCIFAETKAEWLACALGCFKQNFPLVTLYANLGDDAIAFGINQVWAIKQLYSVILFCEWSNNYLPY